MTAAYSLIFALGLVVVFLLVLIVGLMRSHAEVLRKLDGLGVRLDTQPDSTSLELGLTRRTTTNETKIPSQLSGVTPDGESAVISLDVGDKPVLLAFLSTTCSSCSVFWERFSSGVVEFRSGLYRTILVTLGPDEESPTRAKNLRRGSAEALMSSQAWQAFEVPGAPYFALIDEGIVIGEGTAATVDALEQFLSDAAGDLSWDRRQVRDRTDRDREEIVDQELREAGIEPGDPRLYHSPGDLGV